MTTVVRLVVVPTIVAGVATLLWPRWLDYGDVGGRMATAPVVVATEEIVEGSVINRKAVAVAYWPVPTVPAGAYPSVDFVVGRVARIHVFKGEALVPARLAPETETPGPTVRITPGKRAYSIRVKDVTGIAGMIQPNSRIDVLVVSNRADRAKGTLAKVFLSNVRVLAIGLHVERGADGRPINSHVATLELTPEEVERLAIASKQGAISLGLRGSH